MTDLRIVKPKKRLYWPPDMYDADRPPTHNLTGWRHYLARHPEKRVRGEAGYVVDMDAPLEQEWIAGQGGVLAKVSDMPKGKRRPKEATKIDFGPALAALSELQVEDEEAAGDSEPEGGEGEADESSPSPPEGDQGGDAGDLADRLKKAGEGAEETE